jgi:hypothetical protein
LKKAILVLAAAVFYPLLASPVTGGFVRVTGVSFPSLGHFHLTGPNFDVTGDFDAYFWPKGLLCVPSPAGCPPDGAATGSDFFGGSGTVGGTSLPRTTFGDVWADGPSFFFFGGPNVAVTGPGTFTGTFTFSGGLCGVDIFGSISQECALNLPSLTGTGKVTMVAEPCRLFCEEHFGEVLVTDVTYTFLTPETNTFILCIPVILVAAARRLFRA